MDGEHELLLDEDNETHERKSRNFVKSMLPRQLKKYWRTFLLALTLFMFGLGFLVVAVYIVLLPDYSVNAPHSYIFFLCAAICIIPGGYHVIYMYCAFTGKEGYKLDELPTFNDN